MVTARRCRETIKIYADSTAKRSSGSAACTARRCNGRPRNTVRRSRGNAVSTNRLITIGPSHEVQRGIRVEAGQLVQLIPGNGVPAGLVRPAPLDRFVNEFGVYQLTLGA